MLVHSQASARPRKSRDIGPLSNDSEWVLRADLHGSGY